MHVTLPLASLSSEAAALAASRTCCFGAAVVIPGRGLTFEYQGELNFPLLSVAKVPIMLTLLDQARNDGRPLTAYETRLLDQMIRASDNSAASTLWKSIGEDDGMNEFLSSTGMAPLESDRYSWGETLASPVYMARLMATLVQGQILDEPGRAQASHLLETVADSQDWGATAGVAGATTGVKNGWYREKDGAMIHSLAYVVHEGRSPYAIAVFTRGNASPLAGIKLIEEFAGLVNAALEAR
jgi:hypothetical protein